METGSRTAPEQTWRAFSLCSVEGASLTKKPSLCTAMVRCPWCKPGDALVASWFDPTWGLLSLHGVSYSYTIGRKAFEQRGLGLSQPADYGLYAAEA